MNNNTKPFHLREHPPGVFAKVINEGRALKSWAAKTWVQRANAWLHEEPHDLELDRGDAIYHVNGYENGFKIKAETLAQRSYL